MGEILLPLFPLEVVLLPEELLPLHIFEERYKTMIGECLQAQNTGGGQAEFGIVRIKGSELATVGCTAHIVNLIRTYEDGRMDILTAGKRRFELLLTNDERAYLRGAIEFFDDEGPDTPSDEEAGFAIAQFERVMRKLGHASELPIQTPRPYRYLSFRLAAALPSDLDVKQQLLSLRDERDRLKRVVQAMEMLSVQVEILQRAQAKAGGNGHARH